MHFLGYGAYGSSTTPVQYALKLGDTARFTFQADPTYHVSGVSGCGVDYTNTGNDVTSYIAITPPLTSYCTVSATFALNQYSVSADDTLT